MTAVAHEAAARSVPRPSGRLWLKWGLAVFAVVETVHFSTGLLVNDWEGWGADFGFWGLGVWVRAAGEVWTSGDLGKTVAGGRAARGELVVG